MFRTIRLLLIAMSTMTVASAAYAQSDPVYTGALNNIALGGYDAVSFFDGDAREGSRTYTADYNGAEWRFASAGTRDRFLANPAAFAPQYGGYCAWAIAEGSLAKGDPRYATIVDGKLYLNFNQAILNRWQSDIDGYITRADGNWPSILSE